jgi:hypothetical protein
MRLRQLCHAEDFTRAAGRQEESQLKIGLFSFSEQDLVIPVNGFRLTGTRTYNLKGLSVGVLFEDNRQAFLCSSAMACAASDFSNRGRMQRESSVVQYARGRLSHPPSAVLLRRTGRIGEGRVRTKFAVEIFPTRHGYVRGSGEASFEVM